jgi:hypothetical protein
MKNNLIFKQPLSPKHKQGKKFKGEMRFALLKFFLLPLSPLRSCLKTDFYYDFLSCKEIKCPAAAVVSPDQTQGTDKFL